MNLQRPILAAGVFALALTLPIGLAGCASGFHFSELTGQRFNKTNLDTFPVVINRVDGRSPLAGQEFTRVNPGVREVEVQGPPTLTSRGEFRSITIDVKVCTRYYIVAVKQNRLDNDFTPRIDWELPVPGCTPPPQGGTQ